MTIALCTQCGTKKFGSFSPCEECGFAPASSEDRAKSILLSDHHYSHTELDEIGEQIKAGREIAYDRNTLDQYVLMDELLESDPEALQCRNCGEDLDFLDQTLCDKCRG